MRPIHLLFLLLICASQSYAQSSTHVVYFDANKGETSELETEKLDAFIEEIKEDELNSIRLVSHHPIDVTEDGTDDFQLQFQRLTDIQNKLLSSLHTPKTEPELSFCQDTQSCTLHQTTSETCDRSAVEIIVKFVGPSIIRSSN